MSKYITGQEIIRDLGLQDFEFYNDYVRAGLTPLNNQGQPYSPHDVMAHLFNLTGQREALFQLNDSIHDLDDESVGALRANRIIPLEQTIEQLEARLAALEGVEWAEFGLPNDQNEANHVLGVLRNLFFDRMEVVKLVGGGDYSKQSVYVDPPKKSRKLRPDQRHRLAVREAAKKVWKEHPEMTIADMIERDELNEVCEGRVYKEDTMRNWIKDLAPDRSPGRRPKKKSE